MCSAEQAYQPAARVDLSRRSQPMTAMDTLTYVVGFVILFALAYLALRANRPPGGR